MVIKASAASQIRTLVAALASDDEVRREGAVARLAVIGPRAVDRLLAAYDSAAPASARIAILRALEGIGDRRALAVARQALGEGGDTGIAAAGLLRALLDAAHEPSAAEALDALVGAALDRSAPRRLRVAAIDALGDVPGDARQRVAAALRSDPDADLQARAGEAPREAVDAEAVWRDAAEGRLPETAADLRDALRPRAATAPLGVLRKLIDAVRQTEGTVEPARRVEWIAVRGALHQALALRGSRIALYDLREAVADARARLPLTFLAALHAVGDASCAEAMAAAYEQAPAEDEQWRHQLAAAFRAVATRARITRRHAAMKRIASRWPRAAAAFLDQ